MTGPVFFSLLCHWELSWVHGDDGACSLYDRITLLVNCCYVHNGYFMYIIFLYFPPSLWSFFHIYLFSCNLVGAISHMLCIPWWHPHLSYLLCKNLSCHCKLLLVLCERWKQTNWIGDVANWKRYQQLDKILIFLYPHYIGEISKVVFKKTLSCNTPAKFNAILFAQHVLAIMRAFHTA